MACVDEEDRKLSMLGGEAEYRAAPMKLKCTSSLKQSSWAPKTEEPVHLLCELPFIVVSRMLL